MQKRNLAWLLAARLLGVDAAVFKGQGTTYDLGNISGGNCNFMSQPAAATTKFAALNAAQWDSTLSCGRCAQVKCTDPQCTSDRSEIVHIVDQCPGCESGDLDLSPDVFESITGMTPSRVAIEWSFVDCPVSGNIEYCLKTGSNPFWVAIQPTNVVSGVKSLTINGKATTMVSSAYYYLLDGDSKETVNLSQVTIAMVGLNGETVKDTVSFESKACVEGSSQFSTGNPSSNDDYALYAANDSPPAASTDESAALSSASTEAPTSTPTTVAPTPTTVLSTPKPTPTPTPTPTSTVSTTSSAESESLTLRPILAPTSTSTSIPESKTTSTPASTSTSTPVPTSTSTSAPEATSLPSMSPQSADETTPTLPVAGASSSSKPAPALPETTEIATLSPEVSADEPRSTTSSPTANEVAPAPPGTYSSISNRDGLDSSTANSGGNLIDTTATDSGESSAPSHSPGSTMEDAAATQSPTTPTPPDAHANTVRTESGGSGIDVTAVVASAGVLLCVGLVVVVVMVVSTRKKAHILEKSDDSVPDYDPGHSFDRGEGSLYSINISPTSVPRWSSL